MNSQSDPFCTVETSSMGSAEIIQGKKEQILAIAAKHGASNVRVFGSAVNGSADPQCDIDVLVDLERGRTLFDLGGLIVDFQQLLKRNVNVVTENNLHWYIKDRILSEAKLI